MKSINIKSQTDPDSELCCSALSEAVLTEPEAEELAVVLKALADPIRLRLVSHIATSETGEVCACDLPEMLGRSQPTMSHHLALLTKAGILEREQRGKWAWFRLQPSRLNAIGSILTGDITST